MSERGFGQVTACTKACSYLELELLPTLSIPATVQHTPGCPNYLAHNGSHQSICPQATSHHTYLCFGGCVALLFTLEGSIPLRRKLKKKLRRIRIGNETYTVPNLIIKVHLHSYTLHIPLFTIMHLQHSRLASRFVFAADQSTKTPVAPIKKIPLLHEVFILSFGGGAFIFVFSLVYFSWKYRWRSTRKTREQRHKYVFKSLCFLLLTEQCELWASHSYADSHGTELSGYETRSWCFSPDGET